MSCTALRATVRIFTRKHCRGQKTQGRYVEPNAAFTPQADFEQTLTHLVGVKTRQARKALQRAAKRIGISDPAALSRVLTAYQEEA